MKALALFHTIECCRFDCLVRRCTCGAAPVTLEAVGDPERFLVGQAAREGELLEDTRCIEALACWEETADGLLLEFTTTYPEDEEAGEEDDDEASE